LGPGSRPRERLCRDVSVGIIGCRRARGAEVRTGYGKARRPRRGLRASPRGTWALADILENARAFQAVRRDPLYAGQREMLGPRRG
jgi:hypothetical protein